MYYFVLTDTNPGVILCTDIVVHWMTEKQAMTQPKKDAKLDVRLPADLAAAAKRKAEQQDRPLSQIVRDLLREWLAAGDQAVTSP
jgi:hypothetical protein